MSVAKKLKYIPLTGGTLRIPCLCNKVLYFNDIFSYFAANRMRIAGIPRLFETTPERFYRPIKSAGGNARRRFLHQWLW
jgi:hypothetical protein